MRRAATAAAGAAMLGCAASAWAQANPGNGRWYRVTPERMTWHGAQAMAEAMGGHLAVVGNDHENIWITHQLNFGGDYHAWLGGRNHGTPTWSWVNGEPFLFARWFLGCPVAMPFETFTVLIVEGSERGAWCNEPGAALRWGVIETCLANCDDSTTSPVLNVADFSCFLTRFAAGDAYANCDGSSEPPVLNVHDFSCFLVRYAAGCQAP